MVNQAGQEPSATESEILPLHKPAVYDKGYFGPAGGRGAPVVRKEAVIWHGIHLSACISSRLQDTPEGGTL